MSTETGAPDPLDQARANANYLLGVTEHYCRLVRLHLELRDDPGVIYDLSLARDHFRRAISTLDPVRAAMRERHTTPGETAGA